MALKVLISDDHELFRDGLKLLLEEALTEPELLESGDFQQTKDILSQHPDVALVMFDIGMPGTSGLNGLHEIKCRYPALPLIVVSALDNPIRIQQIFQLGAEGFISKGSDRVAMIDAVKKVLLGEKISITQQGCGDAYIISSRQIEIIGLIALGRTNKEIAKQLSLSPATIRDYVSSLLTLFECENRTQLVLKAHDVGLAT